LAKEYKLHHLQIKDVIEETKNELVRKKTDDLLLLNFENLGAIS
jgi:hypothetical protein